ncbi:MAG: hypothetical protein HGA59_08730 [Chlorobiaceae bacterium]|jgi:hypothetical protein|nr:hypothetical protein [Chlorobiaceae bacterium]NTV16924.1 hypothetical protein [Chlorobiaceae bacterium]
MGKANNPGNKSKPRVKVSILHLLLVLTGADLILLLAPEYGILNSIQYIPDLYSWPALIAGGILLILGLKGVYKNS